MSGNNNVTVAIPGEPNWEIWWQWSKFDNFQLDIVGFLALLGEGAVLANAQVSALSRLSFLPRLIPAPQALIRTTRPTELSRTAKPMPSYTVRCVELKVKDNPRPTPSRLDRFFRGQPANYDNSGPPLVKAKATGPQTWVTLFGFSETLILLASSVAFGDVVGISNKWTLRLPKATSDSTPGDLVVRYPNGSYLVVKCSEIVARALYFAPEEIDYYIQHPVAYQMLSLLGTLLLMLGIVFLANAKLQLQFAWAGAYVLINIAHWIAAALPESSHWDLTCFDIKEQGVQGGPESDNFTIALWKTILLTKSVQWVKPNEAAPQTGVWSDWVNEAEVEAWKHTKEIGTLVKPIWDGEKDRTTGVVWNGPDANVWDPKERWDELAAAEKAKNLLAAAGQGQAAMENAQAATGNAQAPMGQGQAAEPRRSGVTEISAASATSG
ncbi:hypothetical protein CBER1_00338 [Cercospora berteroae]|uniref:Uncharacterized protein n=1 Tax=Cercospora berteroae TaxID=357750 RepID=A0A2S6C1J1_9PEZI|nr:hypothetical protein CBER1_00338 [Cercospora berteroae]